MNIIDQERDLNRMILNGAMGHFSAEIMRLARLFAGKDAFTIAQILVRGSKPSITKQQQK